MVLVKVGLCILLLAAVASVAALQSSHKESTAPANSNETQLDLSGPDGGLRAAPSSDRLPGTLMTIELINTPASHYMQPFEEDTADSDYRARVQRLASPDARYDPWLARAAREIAYQGALLSDSPPEAGLGFLLRSSGAPELSVTQLILQVSGDDEAVIDRLILSALKNPPKGPGQLLIGIGEAATPSEAYDRRLVAVVARRDFELAPTPRQVPVGQTWHIKGRAPEGFRDAHASVLYPDDRLEEFQVELDDGHFALEIPMGETEGAVSVSIDGTGRGGPGKLLQLVAQVGHALPRSFDMLVPAVEEFVGVVPAEDYAFELLNEDRAQLGLPPLVRDSELAQIARSHSEEMRDLAYFGHQSPVTGLAGDRLVAAGYRASAHSENLAFNDSITEAQSSLLASVGHRRSIVDTHTTRVGIGLARQDTGDRRGWYLTQVFARKVASLDAEKARKKHLATITVARSEAGLARLEHDVELSELARQGCEEALAVEIETLPASIAERASAMTSDRVAVSVSVVYEPETLEPGSLVLSEKLRRIGLAFLQDQEDSHGRSFMVLIVAE